MENLRVSNVVLCLSLKKISQRPDLLLSTAIDRNRNNLIVKTYHNFTVIQDKFLKYIIFNQSGHVNIIGTKNFHSIQNSLNHFSQFIGYNFNQYKIVNSTWTTKIVGDKQPSIIDLHKVQSECVGGKNFYRCSLRPSVFPAGILRHNKLPTVILFKNGTVNIVGARGEGEAREAVSHVLSKVHFI